MGELGAIGIVAGEVRIDADARELPLVDCKRSRSLSVR
jgi:hypothetical protein